MEMDGLDHVLDRPRAEIFELAVELPPHLLVDGIGHADAAGLGQALQASGNVDRVAISVATLDDHVPDVDADAQK